MFELAMRARLPLIHIDTDDILNVEDVISFIAAKPAKQKELPDVLPKTAGATLGLEEGGLYYTSSECKSQAKLYRLCVENDCTIVFVNTEKSVLHFDGGSLYPPQAMVIKWLMENLDIENEEAEELLPAFGGLTLKDVAEVTKLTMTRDETLKVRGVNETRRGYVGKLKGIEQVDTDLNFYLCPPQLNAWLNKNTNFFLHPVHAALIPKGIVADGPPGTGKTLAGKHIAATFGVPLYRLDIGGLMGKYVGESEGNLDAALAQIDQVAPCVVLLDEMEKVFTSTGDSGVTTRVLGKMLWWLQESKAPVFKVMTTNDLKKIPEELYRPGRIDAVMQFMGIDSKAEMSKFGVDAFHVLAKELEHPVTKADELRVKQKVESLWGGDPVPQGKITQIVFDTTKSLLIEAQSKEKAA